jgi:DNA-binding NtrC family response regulator
VPLPKSLWGRLEEMGYKVLIAGRDASLLSRIQKASPRLWVEQTDGEPEAVFATLQTVRAQCPELPIILLSSKPSIEDAVRAIKLGVMDYVPNATSPERLWATLAGALNNVPAARVPQAPESDRGVTPERPIAVDPSMRKILELAEKIGKSRATILIQGESGTGKEVIARHIHRNSERKGGAFVAVNCAALPENLLESELFGHERGAFTGAVTRKKGKFELANGGTLLLDEISEMAVSVQAKLLRVLQEREIDRVGGEVAIPVDTRVIATTNRDLDAETRKGNFRLDLFYRLNVVPLVLPPLSKRPEDIIPLADFFLKTLSKLNHLPTKSLSPEAEDFLTQRAWPGNVRELENLMERATLLIESEVIGPADLQSICMPEAESERRESQSPEVMPLREMEKRMIKEALNEHKGNRTHAAEVLGISVRTLRNKLHEYRRELEKEGLSTQGEADGEES